MSWAWFGIPRPPSRIGSDIRALLNTGTTMFVLILMARVVIVSSIS